MSQELWMAAGILATVWAVAPLHAAGYGIIPLIAVGLVVFAVVSALWVYSPLPSRTLLVFGDPSEETLRRRAGEYWGFTPPEEDD